MAGLVIVTDWNNLCEQFAKLLCNKGVTEKCTCELKYTKPRKDSQLAPQQTLSGTVKEEELTSLCYHLLLTLSVAADCQSLKQTEGDDGKVDDALEQEEEVGVVRRGVDELQLQCTYGKSCGQFHLPAGKERDY